MPLHSAKCSLFLKRSLRLKLSSTKVGVDVCKRQLCFNKGYGKGYPQVGVSGLFLSLVTFLSLIVLHLVLDSFLSFPSVVFSSFHSLSSFLLVVSMSLQRHSHTITLTVWCCSDKLLCENLSMTSLMSAQLYFDVNVK